MEVEVIKPMWFEGQPIGPGEDGQPNPVIDLPVSDATYLQNIGRVQAIVAEIPPVRTGGRRPGGRCGPGR